MAYNNHLTHFLHTMQSKHTNTLFRKKTPILHQAFENDQTTTPPRQNKHRHQSIQLLENNEQNNNKTFFSV